MRLKMDTDCALRILILLEKQYIENPETGILLRDIRREVGGQGQKANRLCNLLFEKGLITRIEEEKKILYYASPELLKKTLYDIIVAVEGCAEIFDLFDRNSSFFEDCGDVLMLTENKIKNELSVISIGDILKVENYTINE